MIHRVLWRRWGRTIAVSLAAVVVSLAVVLVCVVAAAALTRASFGRAWDMEIIGAGILLGCGLGYLAALLMRDAYVRRMIRSWIGSSRCSQCGYSLIGLQAAVGRIGCPECGLSNDILARGLDPTTLTPRISG